MTLDDTSIIFSDLKIPENYASNIKKGLPVEVEFSGYKGKIYEGEVETRTIMGLKAAAAVNSWLKLELELYSDDWLQRLDKSGVGRTSDQKMDAVIKLVIGL